MTQVATELKSEFVELGNTGVLVGPDGRLHVPIGVGWSTSLAVRDDIGRETIVEQAQMLYRMFRLNCDLTLMDVGRIWLVRPQPEHIDGILREGIWVESDAAHYWEICSGQFVLVNGVWFHRVGLDDVETDHRFTHLAHAYDTAQIAATKRQEKFHGTAVRFDPTEPAATSEAVRRALRAAGNI